MLVKIITTILPVYCIGCGAEGELVCDRCQSESLKPRTPTCFYCNKLSDGGHTCVACYAKTRLAGVSIAHRYEGLVEQIIYRLKYGRTKEVADFLSMRLLENIDLRRFDIVTCVAADGVSRRRRGYNQAWLLAKAVARRSDLVLADALGRHIHAGQVGLNRRQRFEAVKDNFYAKNSSLIQGKRVILVDDVLTTGATMSECARVLRGAGASSVWGLVVAKK